MLTLESPISISQAATVTIVGDEAAYNKVYVKDTNGNYVKAGATVSIAAKSAKVLEADADTITAIANEALASFTAVTFTQTGTVTDGDVQYQTAEDVIAALPTSVTVTLGDGTTVSVPVIWEDTDSYDATTDGDYTFTATWGALPAGVNNSGNIAAPTVEVTVAP